MMSIKCAILIFLYLFQVNDARRVHFYDARSMRELPEIESVRSISSGGVAKSTLNDIDAIEKDVDEMEDQIAMESEQPIDVMVAPSPSADTVAALIPLAANEISDKAEEIGYLDSIFGKGTYNRVQDSVHKWTSNRIKSSPQCVERFVCETYRTGENLDGLGYVLMKIANNAVAYTITETFADSLNSKEIARAARYGRTVGTCHTIRCELFDGQQLRTLGNLLTSLEEIISSMFDSIATSINLG